jgi:hypothetical protein
MNKGKNAPAMVSTPRKSPGGAAKPKGGDVRFGAPLSGTKGNTKLPK